MGFSAMLTEHLKNRRMSKFPYFPFVFLLTPFFASSNLFGQKANVYKFIEPASPFRMTAIISKLVTLTLMKLMD
jgi:hypothetical protein